jgi:hypothetical protein
MIRLYFVEGMVNEIPMIACEIFSGFGKQLNFCLPPNFTNENDVENKKLCFRQIT